MRKTGKQITAHPTVQQFQKQQIEMTRLDSGAYISHQNLNRYRADGWVNVLTGLGLGNDKRTAGTLVYNRLVEVDVETMYAADDMSARVVDILPDTAMRKWVDFQGLDEEIELEFQEKLSELRVKQLVTQHLKWGRMYGGAGLMLGTDEYEDLTVPLDPSTVNEILSLTLMTRYELYPSQLQYDPMKKNFGYPEYYRLQLRGASPINGHEIHHSRIVRAEGVELPRRLHIQNQYWGDSVLSRLYDAIRSFNTKSNSIATVLQDFRVGIFKMKNLADMIAMGQDLEIQKRIALVDAAKSVVRSVVIDSDNEDFEQATGQLSGLKELIDDVDQRLVTATGIPLTVLLGRSPGGMGRDGRHEETNWYDMVAAYQEDQVRPILKKIFESVLLTKSSPTRGQIPKGFGFTFNPLWQLDDSEKAKMRYTQAQADAIYMENGAVTPEEMALSRFGSEQWSPDTKIDLGMRRKIETQGNQQEVDPRAQDQEQMQKNPTTGEDLNIEKNLLDSPRHIPPVSLNESGQVDPNSGPIAYRYSQYPKDDRSDGRRRRRRDSGSNYNQHNPGGKTSQNYDPELDYDPSYLKPASTVTPGGKPLANGEREPLRPTQGSSRSYSPSGHLQSAQNDAAKEVKHVSTVAVMHGDRMLMGKRRDTGRWTHPGGHLDPNESPRAGALRELKEETGIEAEDSQLEHLGSQPVQTHTGKNYVIHAYRMNVGAKPPTSMRSDPDQEVNRWEWIDTKDGLPAHVSTNLHSPKNLLLQRMGLQGTTKVDGYILLDMPNARIDHDSSLIVAGKLNPANDPRQFSPTEMYYTQTDPKLPVRKGPQYEGQQDYFYQQEIPMPEARDIAVPPGTSTVSPSEPLNPRPADAPSIAKIKVPGDQVNTDDGNNGTRPAQTIIVSKEAAQSAAAARKMAHQVARGQELQGVDETSTGYRFRVREPGDFQPGTFKSFEVPGMKGVTIVFGTLKK